MYNPFPFDDPRPVNRPELSEKTVKSIISGGNQNVVKKFVATLADRAAKEGVVVALDGYTTTPGRSSLKVTPNQREGVESTSQLPLPSLIMQSTAYGM